MDQILKKLKNKENLSYEESKKAFSIIMEGKASDNQIYDFLTLLSEKGEVSDEIAGGVYILRDKSKRVNVQNCVDTCGTGGDGKNTLNISTASALLLASMGIKVAKHGNKAVSSKCGSGDVLEALKIKINLEPKFKVLRKEELEIFERILDKSRNIVSSWGGKMYFVYLPAYSEHYSFRRFSRFLPNQEHMYRKEVLRIVTKLNIPTIDIVQEVFDDHYEEQATENNNNIPMIFFCAWQVVSEASEYLHSCRSIRQSLRIVQV